MPQNRISDGCGRTQTCSCRKYFIILCANLLAFAVSIILLAIYCPILPFAAPYDGTSGWYRTTTVAYTSNSCNVWLLLSTIFTLLSCVLMCPIYCSCCMVHWTRKTPEVARPNTPAIVFWHRPTEAVTRSNTSPIDPSDVYTIQLTDGDHSLFTPRAAGNWAIQNRRRGWRPTIFGLESGAPGIIADFRIDPPSGVSRGHPSHSPGVHPDNTTRPTTVISSNSLAGPPSYDGLSFTDMPPGYNTLYPVLEQSDDANKNVELSGSVKIT